MRRRDLAALDELDRAGQRVRGAVLERRVVEHQHAPVRFGRGDHLGGLQDVRTHVALVAPEHRRDLRRGLAHHDPVGDGPERRDVLLGHPCGEGLLGLGLCCRHRVLPDYRDRSAIEQPRSRISFRIAGDIITEPIGFVLPACNL